jgi:spore coat protein CotH
LEYIGDNVDDYKKIFTLKTNDNDSDWKALIQLCKTLNETPLDQLEEALAPMLDIDEVLWFLALENALINCDGYWIRASDYAIFRDGAGVFHIIPHDMNEAFQPPMGPGMGGMLGGGPGRRGPGGGRFGAEDRPPGTGQRPGEGPPRGNPPGEQDRPHEIRPGGRAPGRGLGSGGNVDLDPLVGLSDESKPLRSRLLAVPSLKAKYLAHVKQIAEESLDWKTLGPVVAQYEKLIGEEIKADTKKLTSYAAFRQMVSGTAARQGEQRGRPDMGLKQFADQRREFLLSYPEIKALDATTSRRK